jgi:hypothetical protein
VPGRGCKRQELFDRNSVPPAIPEIIVVTERSTLLEVQQTDVSLIDDARIVIARVFR